MAEGRNMLRIVRLFQDEGGRISGGVVLYPPAEDGKKLNAKEANNVYESESVDGFEVWQNNGRFFITPLFGRNTSQKWVFVQKTDKSNVGALLQSLLPLLDDAPKMGERTAVIYEQPIQV